MANLLRTYTLGKDLQFLNVYGGFQNTDGTMTWTLGGGLSRLGTFGGADMIGVTGNPMLDMIAAVDALSTNNEPTLADASLNVGEIQKKSGMLLPELFFGYKYALIVFAVTYYPAAGGTIVYQAGGTGGDLSLTYAAGTRMFAFCGSISNYDDGSKAFGKNIVDLALKPKDIFNNGGDAGANFLPLAYWQD